MPSFASLLYTLSTLSVTLFFAFEESRLLRQLMPPSQGKNLVVWQEKSLGSQFTLMTIVISWDQLILQTNYVKDMKRSEQLTAIDGRCCIGSLIMLSSMLS